MLGVSFAGVDEFGQRRQVGMVLLGSEHGQSWTHEQRHQWCSQASTEASGQVAFALTADDDEAASSD